MWTTEFEPKLITVLREGYSRTLFVQDLLAGLVVGVVAIPLAIIGRRSAECAIFRIPGRKILLERIATVIGYSAQQP
jgi:hypothetical protein